jgi:hypothetical protein
MARLRNERRLVTGLMTHLVRSASVKASNCLNLQPFLTLVRFHSWSLDYDVIWKKISSSPQTDQSRGVDDDRWGFCDQEMFGA